MSEPVNLLHIELQIVSLVEHKPRSVQQLQKRLRLKYPDLLPDYLGRLEEYQLIEEICEEELQAFRQGKCIDTFPAFSANMSGYYYITRTGRLLMEAYRDQARADRRDLLIALVAAVLGGLAGSLATFLSMP